MGAGAGPYQAQILEHYKRPHNRGLLEPSTHRAREANPLCGDDITMMLRVDGLNRIEEVRFDGEGCAISMASASLLTDAVKGKSLEEASALEKTAFLQHLGVPLSAVREQCALLPLRALKSAVARGAAAQAH